MKSCIARPQQRHDDMQPNPKGGYIHSLTMWSDLEGTLEY